MKKWEYRTLTAAHANALHGIPIVKYIDGQEISGWKKRVGG
jgi:hypothetical protein